MNRFKKQLKRLEKWSRKYHPEFWEDNMIKKVGQDDSVKRKVTCKRCGAKLEFLPKDVKTELLYSMNELDGSYDYIDCPQCKTRIELRK
jgi:DNA-directed RNA polymerase subunit RPC12/RpoP